MKYTSNYHSHAGLNSESSSFWQENQNLGPSDPVPCSISHDFQMPFRFSRPLVLNSPVSIQSDYYGIKVDVGVVVLTWMMMPKLLLESKHPIHGDFGILFICRPQSIKFPSSIRPQIYWLYEMGDFASGKIYEEKGFLWSNFGECGQKKSLSVWV